MKYLLHNAKLIKENEFTLNADNRAFLYGDGLFETIIVINNEILYAEDHFERLSSGMRALFIELPKSFSLDSFKNEILKLCNTFTEKSLRIKFQIWRKPGGLYAP